MMTAVPVLSLAIGVTLPPPPTRSVAGTAASFTQLIPALPDHMHAALTARGISAPTPIQQAAIPRALTGESMLLHAETGSGKSLAFLLPALVRLQASFEAGHKVLVVAPTRELAVQLANEAAGLCTREDAVQIVAIGCAPQPAALLEASVICCTAAEFMALGVRGGSTMTGSNKDSPFQGVIEAVLADVRVLVLDELDSLLPVHNVYAGNKQRAGAKKKAENKKYLEADAQVLLRAAIEMCAAPELQLLAASATVSRPYRAKLARVLRRDPLGRWFERQPEIVRPYALAEADLSDRPNAVAVPACVRHMYLPLPAGIKLRRAVPITAAKRAAARRKGGPTLKEKRARKAREAKLAAGVYHEKSDYHPLLVSLEAAFRHTRPSSALVFICRSSGLTVRRATRELATLGVPALALHEAIGLEHASPSAEEGTGASPSLRGSGGEGGDEGGEGEGAVWRNPSAALLGRHSSVSAAFASRLQPAEAATGAATGAATEGATEAAAEAEVDAAGVEHAGVEAGVEAEEEAPLLVTFEDMARGLHFAGVSHVFILGMPDSPATYLHLAGRCGRHGGTDGAVVDGTVLTICPAKSYEQLEGWSRRLGGISFEELKGVQLGPKAKEGGSLRGSGVRF